MLPDSPIETARLTLAPLESRHADGPYLEWLADPDTMRFIEAGRTPSDRSTLVAFIERMNESPHDLLLGMFPRDTAQHIGNIKLGNIDHYHGRADIGLLIGDREYWNRGLATEAINAVASFAGQELNLHRLFAGCHETNPGSVRAFVKAGFEIEGRLRRHARVGDEFVDGLVLGKLLEAH